MKIRTKLLVMGCCTGFFLLAIGLLAVWGGRHDAAAIDELFARHLVGTEQIGLITDEVLSSRSQLLLAIQSDPRLATSKLSAHPVSYFTDRVAGNMVDMDRLWEAYRAIPRQAGEQKRLADACAALSGRFVDEGVKPALAALKAGNYDEAERLTLQKVTPLADETVKVAGDLRTLEHALARKSSDRIRGELRRILFVTLGCILIAIAFGTTVNLAAIFTIGRGTTALVDVSGRVAAGDLTAAATVRSHDELGQIATSFNAIIASYRDLVGRVNATADRLTEAANHLMSNAEQMATGVEEVAAQVSTVATASEEMAATSAEIAQNCHMAADGSRQANDRALAGSSVVAETVSVMERIAERVRSTAQAMGSLGERSDQIGEIVVTIEDIADQTNLLALNAAIEAARAGELGRGFAVVADEVRALAERTTRATREIGGMIRAIQQETTGAVVAMEDGVREVKTGTGDAARSGEALQDILNQINSVNLQVSQIATAAEEQTATTSEITNNIQQITEVMQESAVGAQRSAEAAQELTRVAEELQRLVSRFSLAA